MSRNKIKIFHDTRFKDKRGYLWTSWKKNKIKLRFNHDKFAVSKKNVFRGLHYDNKTWKLVSCVYGKIFLVIVNLDKKSKNYFDCKKLYLDHKKNLTILIPPGFANGHLCLSKECVFHYKLSYPGKYADVKSQKTLLFNDERLNIKWPIKEKFILSSRDQG
ncbi:MAG: dTDP-4-dehydrorhamnose 3,5-epimerase [Candidatus Marinimicrobia bacterium]|nr:dTDP-4-dehydrorhamnose 3,5-epimerase [Candidatus Neomarinimicrobiota bacterium]|tara:strand:+ start:441 stop:923 length:483 start_codon:yes stop_codon:yes gene_type:complete